MAMFAEANGVPSSAILEEDQGHDTIQNIYYSDKIMEANGWHTTEVISSPYHLPRTALILRHYPQLQWNAGRILGPRATTRGEIQTGIRRSLRLLPHSIDRFPPSKYLPKSFGKGIEGGPFKQLRLECHGPLIN